MKKITFITTGQPTTNPRLVKEAETLVNSGYEVKVICCFYEHWAQTFDHELISKHPGMYIFCGGSPAGNKLRYYFTRMRQKICQLMFAKSTIYPIPENAVSRTHAEAVNIARRLNSDLYIVHNLGALPAAVKAARKNNAKVGYDAEDMHSAQFTSSRDPMYYLNRFIEDKYFKETSYFTAASPLIAALYQEKFPFLKPTVINNVFPKLPQKQIHRPAPDQPVRLFWFSQTIGAERGIETMIDAMRLVRNPVELHLLGNCSQLYRNHLLKLTVQAGLPPHSVTLHSPVSPNSIFGMAAQFDIGVASETGVPLNRDICLTNKIFTYLQCGLALIASDTRAQSAFLAEYPECGRLYKKNDAVSLAEALNTFLDDRDLLLQTRLLNFQNGQQSLNWETESEKFISAVHQVLSE